MTTKPLRILALNFGSTSSKVALFEDGVCAARETIAHPTDELAQFETFWDQEAYRYDAVLGFLDRQGRAPEDFDAFVCWGGHTEPVEDGVYRITEKLLEQTRSGRYGNHPADLAPTITSRLAAGRVPALSIDPPTIDEFGPLARYTGLPQVQRKSRMQTLNQKAVARRYAADTGTSYDAVNLIVVHMGGGTSIVAHRRGKMVDANNGLDGDGPMASNRAGTLPAGDLIDLCFAEGATRAGMRRLVTGSGGLVAHLGTADTREVERMIADGDEHAREVYDAMIYQIAKEIGAQAVVLGGKVDAIVLTGGVANSTYVVETLAERVGWIAPVRAYPGELEMESLGAVATRALRGDEAIKEL